MDDGEAQAISLAMEIEDSVLVLDEKKARRVAIQLNLKIIGTIGLLLRAKRDGIITEVKPILQSLQNNDFRISQALFQKALFLAKEY